MNSRLSQKIFLPGTGPRHTTHLVSHINHSVSGFCHLQLNLSRQVNPPSPFSFWISHPDRPVHGTAPQRRSFPNPTRLSSSPLSFRLPPSSRIHRSLTPDLISPVTFPPFSSYQASRLYQIRPSSYPLPNPSLSFNLVYQISPIKNKSVGASDSDSDSDLAHYANTDLASDRVHYEWMK